MRIVELILDETAPINGVDTISIVSSPAIESNFIALKNDLEIKLKAIDPERHVLMGAALIPNKMIFRKAPKDGEQDFHCYFSAATVRKASELFLQRGNQNSTSIEHEIKLTGLTVVESWIVEGEQDKSRMFGIDAPIGTWMVSMKVNNPGVWDEFVKTGKVQGFSIEGAFAERLEMSKQEPSEAERIVAELRAIFENQTV